MGGRLARTRSNVRPSVSALIRGHRWLPPAAFLITGLAFAIVIAARTDLIWEAAVGVILLGTAYVWGYLARALRQVN